MRCAALAFLLLASCQSNAIPPGSGEGLTAYDREPPAGAETFDRPVWTPGDRFVVERGTRITLQLRVMESPEDGFLLVDERSGLRRWLTEDLALYRKDFADDDEAVRLRDPEDRALCWPLWVGKRWTVHFLRKGPGAVMPIRADYHCDTQEKIVTPAGEFDCLRIWRRAQPLVPDRKFMENVEIAWYAPEVGWFVRHLENGVMYELEEFHRQAR